MQSAWEHAGHGLGDGFCCPDAALRHFLEHACAAVKTLGGQRWAKVTNGMQTLRQLSQDLDQILRTKRCCSVRGCSLGLRGQTGWKYPGLNEAWSPTSEHHTALNHPIDAMCDVVMSSVLPASLEHRGLATEGRKFPERCRVHNGRPLEFQAQKCPPHTR
jgi:hypothetical protein